MRSLVQVFVALCLFASLAASPSQYYDWYGPFEHAHDSCGNMCVGTETCGQSTTASKSTSSSTSSSTTTGYTTASTTPSSTTSGPSTTGFTTVSPGYTPTPGQCVCVSTTASVSTSAYTYPTTQNPAITCPCELVNDLWSLTYYLYDVDYNYFVSWLEGIQTNILCDQTLSDQDKYFECVFSLEELFEEYPELKAKLEFKEFSDGFGCVSDLYKTVTELQYESSFTQSLVVVESSNNSCELFDDFWSCGCWTSQEQSALQALFNDISVNVLDVSYLGFSDKCILIYQKFYQFFQSNPSFSEKKFKNVKIPGFGNFGEFYKMCETQFALYTIDYDIGGTFTNCPIMEAIYSAGHNSSYYGSLAAEFQELYSELLVCGSDSDDFVRLDHFANITWAYVQLHPEIREALLALSYEITAYGCTLTVNIYDVLWYSFWNYKYGFSCHLPLTTTSASSTTPTTPTTTTAKCASVQYLWASVTGNVNNSCPVIEAFWDGYMNSWNSSVQNALFSIINRCNNYQNQGGTWNQVGDRVFNYLGNGNCGPSGNCNYQNIMMWSTVKLNGVAWGRVCDVAGCMPECASNTTLQCH